MAGETLQLINSAAQVSSDAFNRIDRAMSQQIEANQRAGEFAVNMTAKTADAVETARMHDATIQQMQAETYLRGEEVAMRKSLMPLEVAAKTLEIQTRQAVIARQLREDSLKKSEEIFSTYNDLAGREVLSTGNPEHAKDYLRYRAQWQSHLLNGGKFDAATFEKGLQQINSNYAGQTMPEGSDWNAETQNLYNSISPQLGKAYEMRNPVVKRNLGALAMTSLTMSNNDFTDFGAKIGGQAFGDQFGALTIGRLKYQDNEKAIEKLRTRNQQLMNAQYSEQIESEEKAIIKKELESNNASIAAAERENNLIRANYAANKYGVPSEKDSDFLKQGPPSQEITTGRKDLEKQKDEQVTKLGFKVDNSMDLKGKDVTNRLSDVLAIASDSRKDENGDPVNESETEFRFLDFGWWSEKRPKGEVDNKTKLNIIQRIQQGIDATGKVGDVVTQNKINKLFDKLDGTKTIEMPVSDFTAEALGMKQPTSGFIAAPGGLYATEPQKQVLYFGKKKDSILPGTQFESPEDIAKYVEKVKNKGDREVVLSELYSLLAAATFTQALNNAR